MNVLAILVEMVPPVVMASTDTHVIASKVSQVKFGFSIFSAVSHIYRYYKLEKLGLFLFVGFIAY